MALWVSEKKVYDDRVYEATIEPGLKVIVICRPGCWIKHVACATRFGSIDRMFHDPETDEIVEVSPGVAHFLEHIMFDHPDGNVLERFTRLGANSNAYTGKFYTIYKFSAVERFGKSLDLLLDFIQQPQFTPDSVRKTQRIIGREIAAAYDNPMQQAHHDLLSAMYWSHPVRERILGSLETISGVTPEHLSMIHRVFYHPSNMILCVLGDVDPEYVLERIALRLTRSDQVPNRRSGRPFVDEKKTVAVPRAKRFMAISRPLALWGLKLQPLSPDERGLRRYLLGDMIAECIFGTISERAETMYRRGLITNSYRYGLEVVPGAAHWVVGGETADPEAAFVEWTGDLRRVMGDGLDVRLFEAARRKALGRTLAVVDSFEELAHEHLVYRCHNWDFYERPRILADLTVEEANHWLRRYTDPDLIQMVQAAIFPGKGVA